MDLQAILESPNPQDPPDLPDREDPATPSHRAIELTRDEKLRIQTLYIYAKWSYSRLAEVFGKTYRQVQLACTTRLTPQKARCGWKALLNTPLKQ